jgi:hypothetical protein
VAGCTTTDALSGVAINAAVIITGGNGHGEGKFTATCRGGTDNAGNLASAIAVTYDVVADVSRLVDVDIVDAEIHDQRGDHFDTDSSDTMTVRNTSERNIYGPLQVVLTELPPGVTLLNPTGTYLGKPYITIPGVTKLEPHRSASVRVQFNKPINGRLGFESKTYSGQFN